MRSWAVLWVFLVILTGFVGNVEAQWRSVRYYGGSDFEFAGHLVVDPQGSSYFLGQTYSADMDPGIVPQSPDGRPMATFVYKLNAQGTREYAVTVGTSQFAMRPLDLAVGADGSAHVLLIDGQNVRHVIRLDAAGRETVRLTINPLATQDYADAIAADIDGSTIVAGTKAGEGPFVRRIDRGGVVSDVYRVRASATVKDVAIDAAGEVYLLGVADAGDLPITAGAYQPQFKAGECPSPERPSITHPCTDVFVLKLTRAGAVSYATYFGGSDWEDAWRIAIDGAGSAVLIGATYSRDLPLVAPVRTQCSRFLALPCGEGFIAKLDPRGRALVFSTYLGARASRIAVDAAGTVYAAGTAAPSSALPITRAPQPAFGGGLTDGFVMALMPDGRLLWSTYAGGSQDDAVVGLGIVNGSIYFGGETMSVEFGTDGPPFRGGRDLFLGRVFDPLAQQ